MQTKWGALGRHLAGRTYHNVPGSLHVSARALKALQQGGCCNQRATFRNQFICAELKALQLRKGWPLHMLMQELRWPLQCWPL